MNDRDGAGGRRGGSGFAGGLHGPSDDESISRADFDLLARVADLYEALDPTPDMLPELVLFGMQAVDIDAELARLVESEVLAPAARAVEQARRVTFSSDHLTVMIAASERGRESLRLDGWSTPGGGLRVEVRAGETVQSTTCDADGRFSFDGIPRGMVQLTLSPTADSDPAVAVPVVTPAVHL